MSLTPVTLHARKCTLYLRSEFGLGIRAVEAREVALTLRPFAQYASAIEVCFKRSGDRNWREYVETFEPSLVIVDGWGHPKMQNWKVDRATPDMTVRRALYSSCDPQWDIDFDAMLRERQLPVLADYRGYNTYIRLAPEVEVAS